MVDYYYPSGKKHREVFFVKKQFKNGECVRAYVETEKWRIVHSVEGLVNNAALRILADAVAAEIQGQRDRGTVVDVLTGWQEWIPGQSFSPKDTKSFAFNWTWDEWHKKWFDRRAERKNWDAPPQEKPRPRPVLRAKPNASSKQSTKVEFDRRGAPPRGHSEEKSVVPTPVWQREGVKRGAHEGVFRPQEAIRFEVRALWRPAIPKRDPHCPCLNTIR